MIKTLGLADNLSTTLVDLVLGQTIADPVASTQIELILPTKRACLSVKNAFLQRAENKPILLPKMSALYELDDLSENIPPAMSKLERTLRLTKLFAGTSGSKEHIKTNMTPDQAVKVAISLGELLDEFYQFETQTERLADLVQNPVFAEHWNITVAFLDVITKEWPKILAQEGVIDEADRQIRLINAYAKKIQESNQTVIAAGLDGGLPAVRRLLATIDSLPNGLILTEGLDTSLTEADWDTLPAYHYQTGFHQILKALGKKSTDVKFDRKSTIRENLIATVLKPETETDRWRNGKIEPQSVENLTRIDCDTPNEEALTIALLLREALEKPEQTAALVTPDRHLAQRVILEMKRWGIILDDSAGTPVPQTNLGIFLRLLTEMAIHQERGADMLALLKHPLTADGQNPMSFRQRVQQWEKEARSDGTNFMPELNTNLRSFIQLFTPNQAIPFKTLLSAHIQVAEALATSHDRTGAERLWSDSTGQTVFQFLADLNEKADLIDDVVIEPAFYPAIMDLLLGTLTARPTYGMHPRLDVLGPIEARFHHYDVCIIGGLNEGTFPGIPEVSPWLNRPMRQVLGLPAPENKIASLALDFAHCFCSPKVILTRAKKVDGAETIPSRFLARLDAVLTGSGIDFTPHTAAWAKTLDMPAKSDDIEPPAPCPPVEARPNSLSVTKVELWIQNPYAIYARYILKLYKLDSLEDKEMPKLYGIAVHKALERFVKKDSNNTNEEELMRLADEALTEAGMNPVDKTFFLARFKQTAQFVIERQQETFGQIQKSLPEEEGSWSIDIEGVPFTLTGKPDRIDFFQLKGETVARILDYKTGTPPSGSVARSGYAPQLPLEALLLLNNGFKGIEPLPIAQLDYWKLAARTKDCKIVHVLSKGTDVNDLLQKHLDGLKQLIITYRNPQMPYRAYPIPGKKPTYDDYEHLARPDEWAHGDDS